MVCEDCRASDASLARLTGELRRRDEELSTLQAKSRKEKLQGKAKLAALRADVEALGDGDEQGAAALLLRLQASESELEKTKAALEEERQSSRDLRQLDADHKIRIRSLEEELSKTVTTLAEVTAMAPKTTSNVEDESRASEDDFRTMRAHLLHKDTRILELNNDLLAKDRQILDLQEECRERSEVLTAKASALRILHGQLQAAERPPTRDASVETLRVDVSGHAPRPSLARLPAPARRPVEAEQDPEEGQDEDRDEDAQLEARLEQSPGRAVPLLFYSRTGSPPPNDPADDGRSSLTTESAPELGDFDARELSPGRSSIRHLNSHLEGMLERVSHIQKSLGDEELQAGPSLLVSKKESRKKSKKRVTWDLKEEGQGQGSKEAGEAAELRQENEELRASLSDIEALISDLTATDESAAAALAERDERVRALEAELDDLRRDSTNSLLKAKASFNAKASDLEEAAEALRSELDSSQKEIQRLEAELDKAGEANRGLAAQRDAVFQDLEPLKETVATSREMIASLESDKRRLQKKLREGEEALEEAEESLQESRRRCEELEGRNEELLGDLDPAASSLENSTHVIESQEALVYELQAQLASTNEELLEAKGTAESLLSQKQSVLNDMDALREAIEASQQVIDALETDLEAATDELAELRCERGEAVHELHSQSTATKLKGRAWEVKLRQLEQEKEELQAQQAQLRNKLRSQEGRAISREREDSKATQDRLTHLELQVTFYKEESDEATAKLDKCNEELRHMRVRCDELESQSRDQSKSSKAQSEEVEEELKRLWEREAEMKRHLGEAEATVERIRRHRNQLLKQVEEAAANEATLDQKLSETSRELASARLEASAMRDRMAVLESGATEATIAAAGELEKVRQHYTRMEAENLRLAGEAERGVAEAAKAATERHGLATELDAQRQDADAARRQANEADANAQAWRRACEQSQRAVEDLQKDLDQTKSHLRAKSVNFGDQEKAVAELEVSNSALRTEKLSLLESLEAKSVAMEAARSEAEGRLAEAEALAEQRTSELEARKEALSAELFEANASLQQAASQLLASQKKEAKVGRTLKQIVEALRSEAVAGWAQPEGTSLLDAARTAIRGLVAQAKVAEAEVVARRQLDAELAQLRQAAGASSVQMLRSDPTECAHEQLAPRIAALELQLADSRSAEEQSKALVAALAADKTAAEQKLLEAQAALEALELETEDVRKRSNSQLQSELDAANGLAQANLEALRDQMQAQVEALMQERDELRLALQAHQSQTETTQAAEELAAAKGQLAAESAKAAHLGMEREQLISELAGKNQMLAESEAQSAEAERGLVELRSAAEELESTVVLRDSELAQLRARLSELEAARLVDDAADTGEGAMAEVDQDRFARLSQELGELRSQLAAAAAERDRLSTDRQTLCQEILDLNTSLSQAKAAGDQHTAILDGLNQTIEVLVAENDELKAAAEASAGATDAPEADAHAAETAPVLEAAAEATLEAESELVVSDGTGEVKLRLDGEEWSGRLTTLEEENQLLRHCLNETEASNLGHLNRVEELELLEEAQKRVIDHLRRQSEAVRDLSSLRQTTLEEISQHRSEMASSFEDLGGALEKLKAKEAVLSALQEQKGQVEAAYQELATHYTQLQEAYSNLYQQYTQMSEQAQSGQAAQPAALSAAAVTLDAETMTEVDEAATAAPPKESLDENKRLILRLKAKVKKLQLALEEEKTKAVAAAEAAPVESLPSAAAAPSVGDYLLPELLGLKQQVAELRTDKAGLENELGELRATQAAELERLEADMAGYSQHLSVIGSSADAARSARLLQEENRQLEETSRAQTEELASLKHMWYGIEAERSQLEATNQQLQGQLSARGSVEPDVGAAEIQSLRAQVAALQDQKAHLEATLQGQDASADSSAELVGLRTQVTVLLEQNGMLEARLAEPSHTPTGGEAERLGEENALLESQMGELMEKNAALILELEQREAEGSPERVLHLEASLQRTSSEVEDLSSRLSFTAAHNQELLHEAGNVEDYKIRLQEVSELHQERHTEMVAEVDALQARIRELEAQLTTAQQAVPLETATEDPSVAQLEARIAELESGAEDAAWFESEAARLEEEKAAVVRQLEASVAELGRLPGLEGETERLTAANTELQNRLHSLETQCNDWQQHQIDSTADAPEPQLADQLQQLQASLQASEEAKATLQGQLEELQSSLAAAQEAKAELEVSLVSEAELWASLAAAEKAKAVMEAAVEPLERRLMETEERLAAEEGRSAELQARLEGQAAPVDSAELDTLKASLAGTATELEQAKAELEMLQSEASKAPVNDSELAELRAQLSASERSLKKAEAETEALREEMEGREAELEEELKEKEQELKALAKRADEAHAALARMEAQATEPQVPTLQEEPIPSQDATDAALEEADEADAQRQMMKELCETMNLTPSLEGESVADWPRIIAAVQATTAGATGEAAQLSAAVQSLRERVSELEGEMQAAAEERTLLQHQFEEDMGQVLEDKSRLKTAMDAATKAKEELKTKMELVETEKARLDDSLARAAEEREALNTSLQAELQSALGEREELQAALSDARAQQSEHEQQLGAALADKDALQRSLEAAEVAERSARAALAERELKVEQAQLTQASSEDQRPSEEAVSRLTAELATWRERCEALEGLLAGAEERRSSEESTTLQRSREEAHQLHGQLCQLQERNAALKAQLAELQAAQMSLEEGLAEREGTDSAGEARLHELEALARAAEAEKQLLEARLAAAQDEAEQRLAAAQRELAVWKELCQASETAAAAAVSEREDQLTSEVLALKMELARQQDEYSESAEATVEQVQELKLQLAQKTAAFENDSEDSAQDKLVFQAQLSDKTAALEAVEAELGRVNQELRVALEESQLISVQAAQAVPGQSEALLAAEERHAKALESLAMEHELRLTDLQTELTLAQRALTQSQASSTDQATTELLDTELDKLRDELASLTASRNSDQEEVSSLRAVKKTSEDEIAALRVELDAQAASLVNLADLRVAFDELQTELATKDSELEVLRGELSELRANQAAQESQQELQGEPEALTELRSLASSAPMSPVQPADDELAALTAAQEALELPSPNDSVSEVSWGSHDVGTLMREATEAADEDFASPTTRLLLPSGPPVAEAPSLVLGLVRHLRSFLRRQGIRNAYARLTGRWLGLFYVALLHLLLLYLALYTCPPIERQSEHE